MCKYPAPRWTHNQSPLYIDLMTKIIKEKWDARKVFCENMFPELEIETVKISLTVRKTRKRKQTHVTLDDDSTCQIM